MGGKSSTSTQSVGIPSQVLAQYQAVNQDATATAQTPFQSYGVAGATNADGTAQQFVAPVNAQQTAGINATNTAANQAQPYYGAATNTLQNAQAGTTGTNNAALGLTAASAQQVNATPLTGSQINQYMSPYLQDVVGSESALLNQNNQQQQAGQLGTAISSGAFGGDRTGIAAANLEQQQNLSNANIYSGLLNTGYNNALSTAQQQQGVQLGAAQANRAALGTAGQQLASIGQTQYGEGANTSSALAALGTGAQTAGLQGASAQLAAGTVQQQTQQAQDTAEYNQFEQQQSYPFQVDQFLANIAEGTGALSGSTTTTSQPGGFFSDERLKTDKKPIGKTYDGQTIYSYKMKGDPRTRIGLMAQDVEDKHPEAVGLAAGYKTVDYGKATASAANKSHFYAGGVVPIRKAAGGGVDPYDIQAILAAQQQMYGAQGLGGMATSGSPHGGKAIVPASEGSHGSLQVASGGLNKQPTGAQNTAGAMQLVNEGHGLYKDFGGGSTPSQTPQTTGTGMTDATMYGNGATSGFVSDADLNAMAQQGLQPDTSDPTMRRGGRAGYLDGGMPYSQDDGSLDIPDQQNKNQLSKPAALPKPSPTGFQQLMSMGQGAGGMGGMMGGLGGGGGGANADMGGADFGDDGAGWGAEAASAYFKGGPVADHRQAGVMPRVADTWRAHRAAGGTDENVPADDDAPSLSVDQATPLAQGAPNTSLNSVKHAALAVGEAYIGDYAGAADQAYQAYNSTQQNNKRGGRIGKDSGGGLDPADPTQDPDLPADYRPDLGQSVDADRHFSGVAPDKVSYSGGVSPSIPVTAADPGAAPIMPAVEADAPTSSGLSAGTPTPKYDASRETAPAQSSEDHWYKHASNIIPLLQGIAAMGTAPTKHLGVALAAGLGAGAGSYVPTQEGLANASLTNQHARQAGYEADLQQASNNLAIPIINNAGKSPMGATASAPASPDPAAPLPDQLRQKYQNPPVTPQEARQLQAFGYQSAATKNPEWAAPIKQQIANRQAATDYANKQDAQQNYDAAVYTATHAQDPSVRASAAATADAYRQWTGDEAVTQDGVQLNKRTTQPFIGAEAQRLPPRVYTDLMAQAVAKQPVPTGDGGSVLMPTWKIAGAQSAQAYVASLPPQGTPGVPGTTAATPTAGVSPTVAPAAPQGAVPQPARSLNQAPASAPAVAPKPAPIAARPVAPKMDPVVAKAFSDPEYKVKPVGRGTGSTPSIEDQKQMDATSAKKKELQEDAESTAQSSAAALQYAESAKKILDSKGAPVTGMFGQAAKALSSVFGTVDATNYQEAAKYLGNLAVQSSKGNFPHATEKENMVQFEQLSPSLAQTPQAIRELLQTNIDTAKYTLDTANRAGKYIASNGDPQKFYRWNENYFPRAQAINKSSGPPTISSKEEYDALPKGPYIFNGRQGIKQ